MADFTTYLWEIYFRLSITKGKCNFKYRIYFNKVYTVGITNAIWFAY
ncbi:hypothetical protein PAV_2c08200 [Paenibacillus alvei DSM 29]|nr:hypothetical protein PAV_2c08200 [Paenibacillus alvei DSM 29]